ncbi:hypothetical protein ACA910_018223 [Epithemia clementina (nom. ined.)]
MDSETKFHYFWQDHTPFSQWHESHYTLDGYQYVCAEQGMMHGKALLFKEMEVAKEIMQTGSPRKMKSLGRKVNGFDDKVWAEHRRNIVYRNSVAKYTQNEHLRQALLDTGARTILVEASPLDRIWGIGLDEAQARETPPSQWKGLNLLGQILTQVRNEIASGVHDALIRQPEEKEVDNHQVDNISSNFLEQTEKS